MLAKCGSGQSASVRRVSESAVVIVVVKVVVIDKTVRGDEVLHEKVLPPVVVVIHPKTFAPAIARGHNSCSVTHVGESSVSVAVKKEIAFKSPPLLTLAAFSNIEVELTVVIVITQRHAVPVRAVQRIELTQIAKTTRCSDISECAISMT